MGWKRNCGIIKITESIKYIDYNKETMPEEIIPKEIILNSETKEVLIEMLELFNKNSIKKLMSEKGTKYLKKRYDGLNEQTYLTGLLDAKNKARLRIKKLENKQMFTLKFIEEIRYTFEYIFININEQLGLYEDKQFCEEQMKKFNKFKKIYNELYPNTHFNFEALLKGNTPYDDDYIKM